jgi:hypothetical protein
VSSPVCPTSQTRTRRASRDLSARHCRGLHEQAPRPPAEGRQGSQRSQFRHERAPDSATTRHSTETLKAPPDLDRQARAFSAPRPVGAVWSFSAAVLGAWPLIRLRPRACKRAERATLSSRGAQAQRPGRGHLAKRNPPRRLTSDSVTKARTRVALHTCPVETLSVRVCNTDDRLRCAVKIAMNQPGLRSAGSSQPMVRPCGHLCHDRTRIVPGGPPARERARTCLLRRSRQVAREPGACASNVMSPCDGASAASSRRAQQGRDRPLFAQMVRLSRRAAGPAALSCRAGAVHGEFTFGQ